MPLIIRSFFNSIVTDLDSSVLKNEKNNIAAVRAGYLRTCVPVTLRVVGVAVSLIWTGAVLGGEYALGLIWDESHFDLAQSASKIRKRLRKKKVRNTSKKSPQIGGWVRMIVDGRFKLTP